MLGITIHTHGNEPSGLAVLSHFREKFPLEQHLRKYHEYFVDGSLMFPDTSYLLEKPFETYAKFMAGEKLATNGQNDILAPFTGHSIFAPQGISVKNTNEEVMFFLRPPKTIVIK